MCHTECLGHPYANISVQHKTAMESDLPTQFRGVRTRGAESMVLFQTAFQWLNYLRLLAVSDLMDWQIVGLYRARHTLHQRRNRGRGAAVPSLNVGIEIFVLLTFANLLTDCQVRQFSLLVMIFTLDAPSPLVNIFVRHCSRILCLCQ